MANIVNDIKKEVINEADEVTKFKIDQKYRSGRIYFTVFDKYKTKSLAISTSYLDKDSGVRKFNNFTIFPRDVDALIRGLQHFKENFGIEFTDDGIQVLND